MWVCVCNVYTNLVFLVNFPNEAISVFMFIGERRTIKKKKKEQQCLFDIWCYLIVSNVSIAESSALLLLETAVVYSIYHDEKDDKHTTTTTAGKKHTHKSIYKNQWFERWRKIHGKKTINSSKIFHSCMNRSQAEMRQSKRKIESERERAKKRTPTETSYKIPTTKLLLSMSCGHHR